MTIIHLIILVLLIVQFYLIQVPGVCTGHSLDHAANVRRDSMVNDSALVDIVGLCLWVLVHIIGPRVRKCLFIDPFIYEPVDNERNMIIYFCCTSIGL